MPTERAGRSPKAKGQRDSEGGLERRVELEWMKQYVLISILYPPPCLGVYGGFVLCIRIALRLDPGERQLIYKKRSIMPVMRQASPTNELATSHTRQANRSTRPGNGLMPMWTVLIARWRRRPPRPRVGCRGGLEVAATVGRNKPVATHLC